MLERAISEPSCILLLNHDDMPGDKSLIRSNQYRDLLDLGIYFGVCPPRRQATRRRSHPSDDPRSAGLTCPHGDLFVDDDVGAGSLEIGYVPVIPAPGRNGHLGPQPPDHVYDSDRSMGVGTVTTAMHTPARPACIKTSS